MREILFRGKSIKTQRWITGFLFKDEEGKTYMGYMKKERYYPDTRDWQAVEFYENNPVYTWVFVKEEVVPETVGQYTGLNDKNGVKIFEGDIVKYPEIIETLGTDRFEVVFAWGCFYISRDGLIGTLKTWNESVEAIGNKYDNVEE